MEFFKQQNNQEDCTGLCLYNAVNETGMETLVYMGVTTAGVLLDGQVSMLADGTVGPRRGIVGDRIKPPKDPDTWGMPD